MCLSLFLDVYRIYFLGKVLKKEGDKLIEIRAKKKSCFWEKNVNINHLYYRDQDMVLFYLLHHLGG